MEKVTVAIPTIGREEMLPAVLNSIALQTYPVDELIILDESAKPISENYAIRQALDLFSLQGSRVVLLRERRKKGIGHARYQLAEESRNGLILQVDDDVVLRPECLLKLVAALCVYNGGSCSWAVPECLLVPSDLVLDGYLDRVVSPDDPEVVKWTSKYPWFIPYYRYDREMLADIPCAGTQCILLRTNDVLENCDAITRLGRLPREDTVLTSLLGDGVFTSSAKCIHYEHPSQTDRSNWGTSMFYRLHEAALRDPSGFVKFLEEQE